MDEPARRTLSLSPEQASFMDEMVASGMYSSATDVLGAALDTLRNSNEVLETWLREEVAPTYDLMKADPSRGIPAEDVFTELRALHAARLKTMRAG